MIIIGIYLGNKDRKQNVIKLFQGNVVAVTRNEYFCRLTE